MNSPMNSLKHNTLAEGCPATANNVDVDHFDRLPHDLLRQIFGHVRDVKALMKCMAVCISWRDQARQVESASLVCPGPFKTYWDRIWAVVDRVQGLTSLKNLTVKLGTLNIDEEKPACARCMRYAEIGASVDKFVFLAAKSGDVECFDSCLADPGSSSSRFSEPGAARVEGGRVEMNLKQVMGPSDVSLKRMSPVIVFAIIRGFDEFRDAVPCLLLKLRSLRRLLLVDVTDGVTIHVRSHHMDQLRSSAASSDAACRLDEALSALQIDGAAAARAPAPGVLAAAEANPSSPTWLRPTTTTWDRGAADESPAFDISFWRSDRVTSGERHLANVSLCIATRSSVPLGAADLEELRATAVAGPVLSALIGNVNKHYSGRQRL